MALNYLKKHKKMTSIAIDDCKEIISDEHNLEIAYIKEEQKITVHRAIKMLKNEYRQVLWLVYFEDLTLSEAAVILKKSVHSTETLVYRARKSLKSQLEKEGFVYEKL